MGKIADQMITAVEGLLREAGVCEVRLWADPWYPPRTGVAVRVTLTRCDDPREYSGWTLAEALTWLPKHEDG